MAHKNKNSVCCIFNLAPHYRFPIYTLMDQNLPCDFYFGDKLSSFIQTMVVEKLKGYKRTVRNKRILFNQFWWQSGVVGLIFKKQYKHYIITGEPKILSNWFILFFGILLRKKVYLWAHGLNSEPRFMTKLLTYPFHHMASKYLLYSNHAKECMIKLGFPERKMECIYNSLDYEKQLILRNGCIQSEIYEKHFKNSNPVLIYIGRLQKSKKIDMIFEAVKILEEQDIFCNVVLIGENVDSITIHDDKGIDADIKFNVWEYGPCYDEKIISELIYNADVCVSPGNIGLTALHSLTYGTPAITHSNFQNQGPEAEAITPGKTGDFFTENDVFDLSEKIKKWINIPTQQREQVRSDAYSIIDEKYNPHYQLKLLTKLINC